jgi:hypothetical protein
MSEEKEGSWWKGEKSRIRMQVHLGAEGGGLREYSSLTQTGLMLRRGPLDTRFKYGGARSDIRSWWIITAFAIGV